jgi:hypothetical protein
MLLVEQLFTCLFALHVKEMRMYISEEMENMYEFKMLEK